MATATFPTTNKAAYNDARAAANKEKAIKAAQATVDEYAKKIAEGVEVLNKLRALHLAHTGFGADEVFNAIDTLTYNLKHAQESHDRAVRNLQAAKGEQVSTSDREF